MIMLSFKRSGVAITMAIAIVIAIALPVQANDSTARVGAGGLALTKSTAIQMVEEVLSISQDTIDVRYKFHNDSATDITTLVAFPMPKYGWNPGESALDANVGPLGGFKTLVEERAVETRVAIKAWLGKRDITGLLKAEGFNDADMAGLMSCNLGSLEAEQCISRDVAKRLNRRAPGAFDVRMGSPGFEVQETAWWEQKFPALTLLDVQHAYAPKVGRVFSSYTGFESDIETLKPWSPGGNNALESEKAACLKDGSGDALRRRIQRLTRMNEGPVWVTLNDVEYVLGTGRNWKDPIGHFVLRIVKRTPDQIVSVCFPGKARKYDELTLEFEARDFRPPDGLVVYFYTVKTEAQIAREMEEERARQPAAKARK